MVCHHKHTHPCTTVSNVCHDCTSNLNVTKCSLRLALVTYLVSTDYSIANVLNFNENNSVLNRIFCSDYRSQKFLLKPFLKKFVLRRSIDRQETTSLWAAAAPNTIDAVVGSSFCNNDESKSTSSNSDGLGDFDVLEF